VTSSFARWVQTADGAMIGVTVSDGQQRDGCLVGFHSQCSIDPPRYAVWLSKRNRTYRLARRATLLGVHLLADDQRPLAESLGSVTADEDPGKLDGVRTRRHPSGAVLLAECPAWFVGEIVAHLSGGDHRGFVLEPIAAGRGVVQPLRLCDVIDISGGHHA
jgi:flavin reductase (DIM6/NTAB) family NADH-FMN oxidoreductase RutF